MIMNNKDKSKKKVFKLCLLGDGGVGKSTLLERASIGRFNETTKMTIGIGFQLIHVVVKTETANNIVDIGVWDFGGEDQFRFILPKLVLGADGGLILFDVSNFRTMIDLPEWLSIWKKNTPPRTPLLLVGTKFDKITLVQEAIIDRNIHLAKEKLNLHEHFLVSSKTGFNVHKIISRITQDMLQFREEREIKLPIPII
jgi:small GTP-binding protein